VYLFEDDDKVAALQAVRQAAQDAVSAALDDSQLDSVVVGNDVLAAATAAASSSHPQSSRDHTLRQQPPAPGRFDSVDFFDDDHSSYLSIERGIFRGSKRALYEENEKIRYTQDGLGDYFSLGGGGDDASIGREVATEAGTSRISVLSSPHPPTTTGRRKKSWINPVKKPASQMKKRKASSIFNRESLRGLRNNFSQISKEAWMCGICAKSFSSFEAAQKHEDYHIKEVVTDLGWACNPAASLLRNNQDAGSLNMPSLSNHRMNSALESSLPPSFRSAVTSSAPARLTPAPDFNNSLASSRPDVLTMSKRNLTLSRSARFESARQNESTDRFMSVREPANPGSMRYERINDIEESADYDLLVPHGMRDYIVLADEALIDVCSKAQKLILTPLEREAEFELACLSKDKEYYDMLEERETNRRRDGAYSRFRTEGKNIAEKVQNKFVDAYALMKEGKSKKTLATVDHYKRKLRGDADVHNVITNTKDTLYVNVIVKNSLQVVRHELERLAKQRWEEYKAKTNEEDDGTNKDNRNEESRAQFERFKAAAQGNLVKLAGFALASDFTPRRIAVQLSNDLYRYVIWSDFASHIFVSFSFSDTTLSFFLKTLDSSAEATRCFY
jgi:hypothetical protein